MDIEGLIKGIFLLILAVSGNFVAETLGCKSQKLLTENMYVKHIIIFLIIYFALGFTSIDNPHPVDIAKNTLIVWILFIMFTRMSLFFTIIAFSILAIRYVIHSFIAYYQKEDSDGQHKENIELLNTIATYLQNSLIGVVLLGFALYFKKQYSDYYKTWSTFKFIFGVNKCKSLK